LTTPDVSIQIINDYIIEDKSSSKDSAVLLEAPFNATRRQKNSVLLTVDLTKAVANEAIERKASIVISYRKSERRSRPSKSTNGWLTNAAS
jgi:putative NIF3 family GTP cyclohydrolase 1 type 2